VAEYISYYIYNIEGFRDYCVCLSENIMERKDFSGYSDRMEMRIAIRNRESLSPVCEPFDRKDILPKTMTGEEPQIWYFSPLHFQDQCFGYEALRFYDTETTGKLYLYWSIIMGRQIQAILDHQNMQRLIAQLEEMYDRDALTGMYNRRGFENYGKPMFEEAKKEKKTIFLAIIDMDGMKIINDNYGHIEGDFALRKLHEAIEYACPSEMIQARTGGDEFEIIGKGVSEKDGLSYLTKLEHYLDAFNENGEKKYGIHASCGHACRIPSSDDTIERFIKQSDEIMYHNKAANKKRRSEPLR
jgi:diguanylate cyclase (GGDEF)-like protein